MRILIIGGGRFLGRAFAAQALAGGHEVTVFNRGRTSVDLDGVRTVRGDRERPEDLERLVAQTPAPSPAQALGGTRWDAVIDTCGFTPAVVEAGARVLAGHSRAYVFVSSVNAYAQWPERAVGDGSPKFACGPLETEGEYGPLKAGCERAVLEHFPDRTICLDAGLILGPHETSGRLTWWLTRIARGGDVLAPGDPGRRIAPVDARDIARFGLRCIENGHYGAFPTCGPGTETLEDMLEACVRETGSGARLVWAQDEFLTAHGVEEWTALPAWTVAGSAVWDVTSERAADAGLVCRPIGETVRDTWAWLRGLDDLGGLGDEDGRINGHGLSPALETALLAELV